MDLTLQRVQASLDAVRGALLPLAFGFRSGSALLKPLAVAVVGGFALSAVLLLFVLPALLTLGVRGAER